MSFTSGIIVAILKLLLFGPPFHLVDSAKHNLLNFVKHSRPFLRYHLAHFLLPYNQLRNFLLLSFASV